MRIALIAPGFPSWIKTDSEILSTFGDVVEINILERGWNAFARAVCEVRSADLCYFWFGSFRHLPLLLVAWFFDKPVVMVAGGYDVNRADAIGYGQIRHAWLRGWIFDLADKVLAVSEFTRQSALANLDLSPGKVETIPLAVSVPSAPLAPWDKRRSQAVFLISAADDMFLVKGVDRIPEICRALPDVQFKFAGKLSPSVQKFLETSKPANLEILGFLDFHGPKFLNLLNESRVVCAPSRMESFGAAALDGAAMGCVPVSFAVGAVPEILEGIGRLAGEDSLPQFVGLVSGVMSESRINTEGLREHVRDGFSLERRRNSLARVIGLWQADKKRTSDDH